MLNISSRDLPYASAVLSVSRISQIKAAAYSFSWDRGTSVRHEETCIPGHKSGVHMAGWPYVFPPSCRLTGKQEGVLVIGAFATPYRLYLELSPRNVVSEGVLDSMRRQRSLAY